MMGEKDREGKPEELKRRRKFGEKENKREEEGGKRPGGYGKGA